MFTPKKVRNGILSLQMWGIKGSHQKRGLSGDLQPTGMVWRRPSQTLLRGWIAKGQGATGLSWKKKNSNLILGKQFHSEVIQHQSELPREAVEFLWEDSKQQERAKPNSMKLRTQILFQSQPYSEQGPGPDNTQDVCCYVIPCDFLILSFIIIIVYLLFPLLLFPL